MRGLSVCRSVALSYFEPWKNGRSDRDAVWGVELGGPKELCFRWVLTPRVKRHFWGNFKRNVFCTANDWLKEQDQQVFYNGIRALEKRRRKCISVAENYVEK